MPGHKIADMKICVIEKLRKTDPFYRKVRESFFIQKFGATASLMNKKRWQFANCNEKFFMFILVCMYDNLYGKGCQSLTADDAKLSFGEIYPDWDPTRVVILLSIFKVLKVEAFSSKTSKILTTVLKSFNNIKSFIHFIDKQRRSG